MADLFILRQSPLADLAARMEAASDRSTVTLGERPYDAMVSVRVDPDSETAQRLESVLRAPLPRHCGDVTRRGPHTVCWLGPDEWLVITDAEPEGLVDDLRVAVADGHAAIVDVSANRTVIELSGPNARAVLEKGCPLDLHPREFHDHTAVLTTLGRIPVLLWKVHAERFRVLPRSSFAPFLATWLLDAMQEFTPHTRAPGDT